MARTLSYQLLQALRRGAEQLNADARERVCQFVNSQRMTDEAFMNRGGQPDLYYTMFGWMLCYVLGISTDSSRRKAYLKAIETAEFDALHQTVLTICRKLDNLMSLPHFMPDIVLRVMGDDEPLRRFFETYRSHGSGEGTNAWAARLAITQEHDAELVEKLLSMQHETGGFKAHEGMILPDMLSTGVALFALYDKGVTLKYEVRPFIEAHWQDDGSFAATLLDEQGDVEYEFYGLLALGCLL